MGGLPAAFPILRQNFFQTESHQIRGPELTLGGPSAYVSDFDRSGGKSYIVIRGSPPQPPVGTWLLCPALISFFNPWLRWTSSPFLCSPPVPCSQSVWSQAHSLSLLPSIYQLSLPVSYSATCWIPLAFHSCVL